MRELLQKITDLPLLTGTKQELDGLADIILPMEKKSGDDFLIALKNQNETVSKIRPDVIKKAITYLNAWNEMTFALYNWNKRLTATWLQITHKEITVDELVPLTVKMLPNDINQLYKLKSQLEFAALFEKSNENGFYITITHSAVTTKIELLNPQSETSKKYGADSISINEAAEELIRQEKILALITVFEEYQRKIYELIQTKIQARDEIAYLCYYDAVYKNGGHLAVISTIINDMHKENSLLYNYKELIPLADKYIIATDLLFTLTRDKCDSKHKLLEFSEKYADRESQLLNNDETLLGIKILKTITSVLLIDRVTALFGISWPVKDLKFSGVSGLFAKQTKPDSPVQQVKSTISPVTDPPTTAVTIS